MSIQNFYTYSVVLHLLSIIFFNACSSQERNENTKVPTAQIDTLETFLDYNNSGIAQPAAIEVLDGGAIAVLDNKLNQAFVFSKEGDLKFNFGSEGRGPGEFVLSNHLHKSSKYLNILDVMQFRINQFDYRGKFVRSFHYAPSNSRRAFVLGEKQYFAEAMGENNSLIKLVDAASDTAIYFGKPMGKYEEIFNMEMNQKIFDGVVTIARETNSSGIPLLIYLHSMKVVEGETYLLWHRTKEEPQKIVKVDETGKIEKIFTLPRDNFYGEIAIDTQDNLLYVVSGNSGKIFRKKFNEL